MTGFRMYCLTEGAISLGHLRDERQEVGLSMAHEKFLKSALEGASSILPVQWVE